MYNYTGEFTNAPNDCAINNLLNNGPGQNRQNQVQGRIRDDGDTQLCIIQCGLVLPNIDNSLEFDIGA